MGAAGAAARERGRQQEHGRSPGRRPTSALGRASANRWGKYGACTSCLAVEVVVRARDFLIHHPSDAKSGVVLVRHWGWRGKHAVHTVWINTPGWRQGVQCAAASKLNSGYQARMAEVITWGLEPTVRCLLRLITHRCGGGSPGGLAATSQHPGCARLASTVDMYRHLIGTFGCSRTSVLDGCAVASVMQLLLFCWPRPIFTGRVPQLGSLRAHMPTSLPASTRAFLPGYRCILCRRYQQPCNNGCRQRSPPSDLHPRTG